MNLENKSDMSWVVDIDPYYIAAAGSCILLFVNYLTSSDIIALMTTLFLCGYLLFVPKDFLLPTMLFISFFFLLMRSGQYTLYMFIEISFFIAVLMQFPEHRAGLVLITVSYLFLMKLLTIVSGSFRLSLTSIMPDIGFLCSFYACAAYDQSISDRCLSYFTSGFLLSGVCGLFREMTRFDAIYVTDSVRTVSGTLSRFGGLEYDCNFYTVSCLTVIFLFLLRADRVKNGVRALIVTVSLLFGILTVSKSFFAVAAIILLYSLTLSNRGTKKILLGILPLAAAAALYFRNLIFDYLGALLQRLESITDLDSLTTSRSHLLNMYMEHFRTSDIAAKLFGSGAEFRVNGAAAHNTFVELLVQVGVVGCIIILIYVVLLFRQMKGNDENIRLDSLLYAAMIFAFLFNLTLYGYCHLWTWLFCMVAIVKKDWTSEAPVGESVTL